MGAHDDAAPVYVLWIGEGDVPAEILAGRGIHVQRASARIAASEIVRLAPDLVIIAGGAVARAEDLGIELAAQRAACPPPIGLLAPSPASVVQGRWGVVAWIDPALSASDLARGIEALLVQLASPASPTSLALRPGELASFVEGQRTRRRAGVLAWGDPPAALAISAEGAIEPSLTRVPETTVGRSMRYRERAPGKLRIFASPTATASVPSANLSGLGVLVLDGGGSGWRAIVDALEQADAQALLVPAEVSALEQARTVDPALVIVPSTVLAGGAGALILDDPRLSSASILVVPPERVASVSAPEVRAAALEACADELAVRARIHRGEPLIDRIEALGAARWLKTISRAGEAPRRLRFRSALGRGEIVLAGGKIQDARFEPGGASEGASRGAPAVRALVAMRYGTLLVGAKDAALHERPPPSVVDPPMPPPNAQLPAAQPTPPPSAPSAANDRSPPARAASVAEPARAPRPKQHAGEPAAPGSRSGAQPAVAARSSRTSQIGAPARSGPTPPVIEIDARVRSADFDDDEPTTVADAKSVRRQLASIRASAELGHDEPTVRAAEPLIAAVHEKNDRVAEDRAGAAASNDAPAIVAPRPPAPAVQSSTSERFDPPSSVPPPEHAISVRPASETLVARRAGKLGWIGACALIAIGLVAAHRVAIESSPDASTVAPSVAAPPRIAMAVAPTDARSEEAPTAESGERVAPPAPSTIAPDLGRARELVAQSTEANRRREYQRGFALAQEALRFDPQNARAAYDSANALLRLRRDDEALEWVARAIEWDGTEPLYRLLQGDIHQQNGRRARARQEWLGCVEIQPEFAPCRNRLGPEADPVEGTAQAAESADEPASP